MRHERRIKPGGYKLDGRVGYHPEADRGEDRDQPCVKHEQYQTIKCT